MNEADDQAMQIAVALAATRQTLSQVDYALVEEDFLNSINVTIEKTLGTTPDGEVNLLHRDLTNLSARQIFAIANHIYERQSVFRLMTHKIQDGLKEAIKLKRLDPERVNTDLKEKLK